MRNRSVLAALVCSILLSVSPLVADPAVGRGIDVFTTLPDGKTFYDFSNTPIPAGFFCKGSKPFHGRVTLKGLPIATETPGQLGIADTVVERLDDAVFDAKGVATTRTQFRALSLVSIAPVKTSCGAFHVYVSLAGKQRVTTMNVYRTQEGGGTFKAPLAADVRMTFIPAKPSRAKSPRKLELTGSFTFPAKPLPWSFTNTAMNQKIAPILVDTDGDLTPDTRVPSTSNFLPGFSPAREKGFNNCCAEYVCHGVDDDQHCAWVSDGFCLEIMIC